MISKICTKIFLTESHNFNHNKINNINKSKEQQWKSNITSHVNNAWKESKN